MPNHFFLSCRRICLSGLITICFFGSCSPKFSAATKSDFNAVKADLQLLNGEYEAVLGAKYSHLTFNERVVFDSNAKSNRELAAVKLKSNRITDIISNHDESCGIIKVNQVDENARMRVSYIYLADTTTQGGHLADKILGELERGKKFGELAETYSKDGNAEKQGDLGWFDELDMISDFTKAIRKHKTGETYKVFTEEFGWYVISNSHDIEDRTQYSIVEVYKDVCK